MPAHTCIHLCVHFSYNIHSFIMLSPCFYFSETHLNTEITLVLKTRKWISPLIHLYYEKIYLAHFAHAKQNKQILLCVSKKLVCFTTLFFTSPFCLFFLSQWGWLTTENNDKTHNIFNQIHNYYIIKNIVSWVNRYTVYC